MSFILDALRKSENERKRNQPPGLAATRVHRAGKTRNLWIPLVAVLAGINISLLIVMWVTSDDEAAPLAQAAPTTAPGNGNLGAPAATARTAAQRPAPPATPAPVARSNRSLADELQPAQETAQETGQAKSQTTPADVAPQVSAPVPGITTTRTPRPKSDVPTYTEVMLNGSVNLPPLRLDMHVYSDTVDERFVFVNMSKYREGDSLSEGPRITEITPTGVILNDQGTRFLLMRQ